MHLHELPERRSKPWLSLIPVANTKQISLSTMYARNTQNIGLEGRPAHLPRQKEVQKNPQRILWKSSAKA